MISCLSYQIASQKRRNGQSLAGENLPRLKRHANGGTSICNCKTKRSSEIIFDFVLYTRSNLKFYVEQNEF